MERVDTPLNGMGTFTKVVTLGLLGLYIKKNYVAAVTSHGISLFDGSDVGWDGIDHFVGHSVTAGGAPLLKTLLIRLKSGRTVQLNPNTQQNAKEAYALLSRHYNQAIAP